MTAKHHPIRDQEVLVYYCADAAEPYRYRAVFGTSREFPIFFDAGDFHSARARAEAFREEVIAKNEAAFLARENALVKARAARAQKAEGRE